MVQSMPPLGGVWKPHTDKMRLTVWDFVIICGFHVKFLSLR